MSSTATSTTSDSSVEPSTLDFGGFAYLTNSLTSALSSSNTFRLIFRVGVSPQIAGPIATSLIQATLSSGLGVDAESAQRISGRLQNVISDLGGGADTNSYAQAIASTVVSGLSSSGVLNSNNVSDLGVGLVRGILQNASQIAGQYGIRISKNDVASDISRVSNRLLTTMPSTSSTTSFFSSVEPSTLDLGAQADLGAGAPSDLGQPSFPTGPGGYGGAPTSPGYGAPGQASSARFAGLTNGLTSALSSSSTFRSIFRAGVYPQIAARIATSSIEATLSSGLGVDAGSAQRISGSLQNVISKLGGGADTNSYAQAIASSVVSGLSSSGVLNSNNASDLGVGLVRGILQNAAQVSGQYGIRISQNDVASDISRVSNTILSSMSTSAPTTTTSVSSVGSSTFDVGGNGGFDLAAGNGIGASRDLGSLLSSPSGISSPRASGRIQALSKGVLNSLRPDGLDVNSFAQSLSAVIADASSSGLSPAEAKLEALMEALVSLAQILSSAQIRQVDFSNTSALSSSFQRAMVNVLG